MLPHAFGTVGTFDGGSGGMFHSGGLLYSLCWHMLYPWYQQMLYQQSCISEVKIHHFKWENK